VGSEAGKPMKLKEQILKKKGANLEILKRRTCDRLPLNPINIGALLTNATLDALLLITRRDMSVIHRLEDTE
jgi:hypothetical protein